MLTVLELTPLYIHRENFRKEAKDFLSIPDISTSKYQERYTEEKIN